MLGIKWTYEIVGQHRHLNHDTSAERKDGIFPECDHKCGKPVKFGVRILNVISHQETQKSHNFLGFRSSFCLFSYLFWNSNHSQLQFASGLCHHFLLVRPYQQNRNNSWDSMVLNASLYNPKLKLSNAKVTGQLSNVKGQFFCSTMCDRV